MKQYNTILKLTNPRGVVINKNNQRRFEAGTIDNVMHFVSHDLIWVKEEYEELVKNYPNMSIEKIVYKNGEKFPESNFEHAPY